MRVLAAALLAVALPAAADDSLPAMPDWLGPRIRLALHASTMLMPLHDQNGRDFHGCAVETRIEGVEGPEEWRLRAAVVKNGKRVEVAFWSSAVDDGGMTRERVVRPDPAHPHRVEFARVTTYRRGSDFAEIEAEDAPRGALRRLTIKTASGFVTCGPSPATRRRS